MRIEQKPLSSYPWYLRWWFTLQQRRIGQILLPGMVWGRVPQLLIGQTLMFSALNRAASPLEERLRALIGTYISQLSYCEFCIDMNAQMVLDRGGNLDIIAQLPTWRSASNISAREKLALEFAESIISNTLLADARAIIIQREFGDAGYVELAAYCAFQTMSARFNHALQIPAQGLCRVPNAATTARAASSVQSEK